MTQSKDDPSLATSPSRPVSPRAPALPRPRLRRARRRLRRHSSSPPSGFVVAPLLREGRPSLARRRQGRGLQGRRDHQRDLRRRVAAAVGGRHRARPPRGCAARRERVRRVLGQLRPPRVPGALDARRQPLHVPLPRRRLLRRRLRRGRPAAARALALSGPRAMGRTCRSAPNQSRSGDRCSCRRLRKRRRWFDDRLGISKSLGPDHGAPRAGATPSGGTCSAARRSRRSSSRC